MCFLWQPPSVTTAPWFELQRIPHKDPQAPTRICSRSVSMLPRKLCLNYPGEMGVCATQHHLEKHPEVSGSHGCHHSWWACLWPESPLYLGKLVGATATRCEANHTKKTRQLDKRPQWGSVFKGQQVTSRANSNSRPRIDVPGTHETE